MISQVLSVTRNSLRLETAPLTILTIKRGLLCNFAKKIKGRYFIEESSTGLIFSITIEFQIFKTFIAKSFKKYVNNTYFGPEEKMLFFKFSFMLKLLPF